MRTVVPLGDLGSGQKFTYNGRPYQVRKNLGQAGVSVHSATVHRVSVGGRTFDAVDRKTEVWSAGSPVEVES
jgi:hypothetical protein